MPKKPLNQLKSLIGESHVRTVNFQVEPGKVKEFAAAIKNNNPIHRGESQAREAGYKTIPAPLIFTRVSRFPHHQPNDLKGYLGFELGLYQERILHGEQEYQFHRPVYVGDVLTGTTTLVDVYQRESNRVGTMTFFIFETDYVDQNDEPVLSERMTIIETGNSENDQT